MSGHSKWSTIKRKKGAADAQRSKLWGKLLRFVEVAAREGGGSVDANPTLATAVQKARESSVPSDNIQRAIKRGTGELKGEAYEETSYEGYGPGGVAILVTCLTNNRNRAAQDVRGAFNIAADPVLDPDELGKILGARPVPVPAGLVRRVTTLSWRLHLQPTPPGWLDLALRVPILDTTRAHDELGWRPSRSAGDALLDLLAGLREGEGEETPPLDPEKTGPARAEELATGVGETEKP